MASNPTGFKVIFGPPDIDVGYPATPGTYYDLDDIYLRKDKFLNGGLWIWGNGAGGQLGHDRTTSRSSPIQTCISGSRWRKICLSKFDGHNALALTSTGQVWGWGCNDVTQVIGTSGADCLCPVLKTTVDTVKLITTGAAASFYITSGVSDGVYDTCSVGWGCSEGDRLNISGYPTIWADVSLGNRFGIAIADSNLASLGVATDMLPGSLVEWGAGRPSGTGYSVSNTACTISSDSWSCISAGNSHALGIKCDGTLWAWGCNHKGQLGTGDTINRSQLVQVGTSNSWTAITTGCNFSAGILAGQIRSCAAVIYTWGENSSGQLGDSTTLDRSSPVQVSSSCTNWKKISGGDTHFAAIQTDGTLWTWGSNQNGELGLSDSVGRSSPVQIPNSGTGWFQISAGQCATSALKDNSW